MRRGPRVGPRSGHRLDASDHAALALMRATGRSQLIQAVWWYDRAVDRDGLARFVAAFAAGPGNRIVERSGIPGARDRWVRPRTEPCVQFGIGERPRAELLSWADSCAAGPIDPVRGPSWRVDVQDFDDGSAAVCFTASHVIGDAFGAFMILRQSIVGNAVDPGYDCAGSRSALIGAVSDIAQVVRDLPQTVKSLRMVGQMSKGRSRTRHPRGNRSGAASPEDICAVRIPGIVVRVDLDQWNASAHGRDGNAATLLMVFAARLAERVGHIGADGRVTLLMPVSVREGPDDLRALAFRFGRATLDPGASMGHHQPLREALQGVRAAAEVESPAPTLLALVPWLPKRGVRWLVDKLFSYSDEAPVSLSNLGVLASDLGRVDGTEADWFIARPVDIDVRLGDLKRTNGHLVVVASAVRSTDRTQRAWTISVEGYEVGADNSRGHLVEVVSSTLEELGVSGRVETGDDKPTC